VDQTALYAVYFERLQIELREFVLMWNAHHIRLQRNRPNTISGKPEFLYNFPKPAGRDQQIPVRKEFVETLRGSLYSWDHDAFLPDDVIVWCREWFEARSMNPVTQVLQTDDERQSPLFAIYQELRQALYEHNQTGREPLLRLLQTPTREHIQFLNDEDRQVIRDARNRAERGAARPFQREELEEQMYDAEEEDYSIQ
jgi:hypothetical protein